MTDIKERGDRMEGGLRRIRHYARRTNPSTWRRPRITVCLFGSTAGRKAPSLIAVADGKGIKSITATSGLCWRCFDEEILHGLTGRISIGHVRCSTFGSKGCNQRAAAGGAVQDRHAGAGAQRQSVNVDALRRRWRTTARFSRRRVDTEVILNLIARESSKGLPRPSAP